MRRQRYSYTLPSEDDTTVLNYDAEFISSHYSYPETAWSQITGPNSEPLVPFCLYPYQPFQVSPEQFPVYSTVFNPATSHQSSESTGLNNEDFNEIPGVPPACNNTPYGDGFSSRKRSSCDRNEKVESIPVRLTHGRPTVTNYGAVTILLRHLVRVDISGDKAVYVTSPPSSCVASIGGSAERSCAIHPNGRVFHDGPEIHMTTLNRKAKISKRGIVFTSSDHFLSYLVDASGTKTTAEKFRDLRHDFSLEVFRNHSMAEDDLGECFSMADRAEYKSYWNGDEVWFIGGFRIKQNRRGDVKVSRSGGRQLIRSSPTTGQVFVRCFQSEFSIGCYPNNYFFVRRGDKQVSASLNGFNVQNGSQKAGFNSFGKVVLF